MAMRGRGGRGNPSRPPRLIVGRVYDQFKPMSEWRQEDDYDTLLVYLPGFQKEYIKVTTEDLNIVRVRGERLVRENKWSRFQEDFRVPENCEMRGIRAKFDGGILTITMPRKINSAPPPATTTTTAATTQVPPKTEEQSSRTTKQEEPSTKLKEEPKENKLHKPQSSPLDDKTSPPQSVPNSSSVSTKQETLKPTLEENKVNDNITFGSLPATVPKKDTNNVVGKPNVAKKTDLEEDKRVEALLEEVPKRDIEGRKGQLNDENKKVLARRGVLNEDRKVLMNVGVGVLVIVALGVHVSYTIGLIGKGK